MPRRKKTIKIKKPKLLKKKPVKKVKKVLVVKKKKKKIAIKTKKVHKRKLNKIFRKKIVRKRFVKKRVRVKVKKKLFKKPKLKLKKIKRAKPSNPDNDFLTGSFFKAKIKVIGIGGGGGSIVSEIGRSLHKATFVVADTDARAFKKREGIKNFLFGQELTHGLGTGVNPELGRLAAESEKERISHFFDDQDIVIFIASLGGGLGSAATKVFAEAARDFRGITLGIFTLPFKFEGKNKHKIAVKALQELRKVLNVSITIPNERIFKIIKPDTAITDAFSIVNKNLIEGLESLIDLIYSPGIINIDFADLRAILNGRGNLAFLNTIEASGKNRADQIASQILHSPLYQNNNFTTEKIIFNIEGSDNLSMFEVDKISRAISDQHKKAKIIFGISKNLKYKNKIKATLLMTGPSTKASMEEVKIKPQIIKKDVLKNKLTAKPTSKIIKKRNIEKKIIIQKIPLINVSEPVFNNTPFVGEPAEFALKKLDIVEASRNHKKTIRRTALDIKKAEELKENEQSLQEKEWEIPAFLRLKK